jgi:hypothetical protein
VRGDDGGLRREKVVGEGIELDYEGVEVKDCGLGGHCSWT